MSSLYFTQSAPNSWVDDVWSAAKSYDLWSYLAWQDIKIKYRRSKIGPLWITLSMAIFCLAIGVVYSKLFNVKIDQYLPHLSIGYVVWSFIANSLTEYPNLFVANASYIKDIRINPVTILFRAVARNVIIFGHNLIIIAGIYLYFGIWPGITMLWVLPGYLLVLLNLIAIGIPLSIAGARFRDIAPITQSMIQVLFFITPIMWIPRLVPGDSLVLALNPAAYFLDLIRSPLLGNVPALASWVVSLSTLVLALGFSAWIYRSKGYRIPFWV